MRNGHTVEEAFTFIKETGEIVQYDPSIGGINVKIPPTIEGIPVTSISGQYVTAPYGRSVSI
ncbi:hypothetical protein QTH09_16510 [Clostridium perfringens]|nr:hypothetical protein [Clostridium perfringens]